MGAKTLLTVEHLERLPETCDVSYELDQGELVEVSSASLLHNCIRDLVLHRLMTYRDTQSQKDRGVVVAEQWFRLSEDTVRAPDVALVAPSQLALLELERRIQPFSPALAIEITSPSNTFDELARKTQQYLEAGTHAVWIFVTAMREIHVYGAAVHPVILTAEDLLEDAALLPGFSARVEELFAV
jgi:Uma2 family endonuclease